MFASSHTASYNILHPVSRSLLPATTKLLRERHKLLAALGMSEGAGRNLWDTVQGIALDK